MTPPEIARCAAAKLGYPPGDEAPGDLKHEGFVPADGDTWEWEDDPRVKRHQKMLEAQYSFWKDDSTWSMYARSSTGAALSMETLKTTFLNVSTRYHEALNFATEVKTHAKGFTREFPPRAREKGAIPIETWNCYVDGLVTMDSSINQASTSYDRDGVWLNLNATTYEVLRFLQLARRGFAEQRSRH